MILKLSKTPLRDAYEKENSCSCGLCFHACDNDGCIDVLWGGSLLNVGEYEEYFLPYRTENSHNIIPDFRYVGDGITCFSDVPSVLMVNTDLIGDIEIKGYADLLNPELKGKIAFADPSNSSSSFEHLTNFIKSDKDNDYVQRILKETKERYADKISIESFSEELGVSGSYLSRKFKEATGQTYLDFLNKYRIQKAVKLLETGTYKIYEVSEMTGFSDYKYFSTVFKKYTDSSPSDFVK